MENPIQSTQFPPSAGGLSEKVRNIIATYLDLPGELVVEEARFSLDLGADSLEIADIIITLESEFDVEIDDSMLGLFVTVGDIARHLQGLLKARR